MKWPIYTFLFSIFLSSLRHNGKYLTNFSPRNEVINKFLIRIESKTRKKE